MLDREKILPAFSLWGFRSEGTNSGQSYGTCPFCNKSKKFYINEKTALWDCKVCGISGNYIQFLKKIAERNQKEIDKSDWQTLSKDRGLPIEAFQNYGIGIYNKTYTIPVYNELGNLQDLRRFKINSKMKASIGCNIGLWGLQRLVKFRDSNSPVYICEGEWDGIAMNYLLKTLQKPGIVVAVPGAGIFKQEWSSFFKQKDVFVCYDNDDAGRQGEAVVGQQLNSVARSIKYLHWSPQLPEGYDIRDIIKTEVILKNKPNRTFSKLRELFSSSQRTAKAEDSEKVLEEKPEKTNIKEVVDIFNKWLFLKDTKGIEIMLATVVANQIQGDPVWMFLVAPPGSAKTEIIQTLNGCQKVYASSSLTSHSLISGFSLKGNQDPSLIPKIIGKTLAVKDFTTVMDMKEGDRKEIFSTLRDSYDGTCSRSFGNGVERTYKGKFGIIAAVTPIIYGLDSESQSLGERFLKFSIEENLKHLSEDKIIERAIGNTNQEGNMRAEMTEVVTKFLRWIFYKMKDFSTLPPIPKKIENEIISLVKFGSRMRGVVARDKFRSEIINARPSAEIGSRLGKQLAKLSQAIAIVNNREEVTSHEYSMIKKCMMDTLSQKIEDIIRCLHEECPTEDDSVSTKIVSFKTKYPQSTVIRVLQDLAMLEIVKRIGGANKAEWTLTEYSRKLIKKAEIYPTATGEVKQTKEKQYVESI